MAEGTANLFEKLYQQSLSACDKGMGAGGDIRGACAGLQDRGALPELCVNDLEQAAFDVLPSLLQLKERLQEESESSFTSVFMTGTIPHSHGANVLCSFPVSPVSFRA